ncbi:MAG: hypothetical protein J7J92_00645 [Candidatus Aenigmarchaeota archaeon]|nr:hypothetical protein [Candidatus Aenigmarchaeota archaeon]
MSKGAGALIKEVLCIVIGLIIFALFAVPIMQATGNTIAEAGMNLNARYHCEQIAGILNMLSSSDNMTVFYKIPSEKCNVNINVNNSKSVEVFIDQSSYQKSFIDSSIEIVPASFSCKNGAASLKFEKKGDKILITGG